MAIEISVPKLGLTMEDATLVCWKSAAGEMVKRGKIVLVLETDKVTFEMPSPGDGLLHPVAVAGSKTQLRHLLLDIKPINKEMLIMIIIGKSDTALML